MNAAVLTRNLTDIDWQAAWPRQLAALAISVAGLLLIFASDAADMARIWWNVSTYTHCLFILPLVAWLVAQRRAEIVPMQPAIWLPGLAIVAAGAFGWLLGEAGGIALFRHAALVLMVQGAIVTMLGKPVALALFFPIFYLVFLVPFGEEAVPLLQTITAKMCMILLGWTGIPAHIEGVFITTPAGLFEVAEACSGVKFLVAMSAYATLATNVCFVSWKRRAIFLAFALVTPVLANGVRAFGTIWLSEQWGIAFAASFDHIVYGWFFFGFVMLVIAGVSWRFFDRSIDGEWVSAQVKAMAAPQATAPIWGVAAIAAVALLAVGWQAAMGALGRTSVDQAVILPDVPGWTRVNALQSHPWRPRFDGADHRLDAHYVNAAGQQVDLVIALYGWQEEGREMVGFAQGAFDPESEWSWTRATPAPEGGKADLIFAPGAEREVASFYVLDGKATGSSARVKIDTMRARLTGGDQAAVAVLVSAEQGPRQPSRPAIDAFLKAMGSPASIADNMIRQARGE